jgi:uncharacterized membrane protein YidH (DUF202 family)
MNKHDFSFVLGFFITLVNIISLFCSTLTAIRQFKKATRANSKLIAMNFHFCLLITSMAMSSANVLALHRFYNSLIVLKHFSTEYMLLNGFADRIFMCIASVGLLILSLLKVPFFFRSDDH